MPKRTNRGLIIDEEKCLKCFKPTAAKLGHRPIKNIPGNCEKCEIEEDLEWMQITGLKISDDSLAIDRDGEPLKIAVKCIICDEYTEFDDRSYQTPFVCKDCKRAVKWVKRGEVPYWFTGEEG